MLFKFVCQGEEARWKFASGWPLRRGERFCLIQPRQRVGFAPASRKIRGPDRPATAVASHQGSR